MSATQPCAICGSTEDMTRYSVREMMFGYRDRFEYGQCLDCGCLQLLTPPADLSRYYPDEYYSFAPDSRRSRRGLKGMLRTARNRYAFTGRGLLGRLLHLAHPYHFGDAPRWILRSGITRSSPILDVGCGAGDLLCDLASAGYTNLLGVDPFIDSRIDYDNGVRILKATIHELRGLFELIMFHHSLEHIPDQVPTMRSVARLLAEGGHCVIRIPVVSSDAWERYRESWVQLDAPRHFILHSVESIRRLGEKVGLELIEVRYDSTGLQFVGSELYLQDVPLSQADNRYLEREVRRYGKRARELNEQGRGDQAAFFFRKPATRGTQFDLANASESERVPAPPP